MILSSAGSSRKDFVVVTPMQCCLLMPARHVLHGGPSPSAPLIAHSTATGARASPLLSLVNLPILQVGLNKLMLPSPSLSPS
mmetsp:Transcript_9231/g.13630  ORF Transcript_9231/g.13630 Transcript_9231/m.13630 type:complete len:82 (+) Transcript_9231:136-381(+)